MGHQITGATARPFLHFSQSNSQTSVGILVLSVDARFVVASLCQHGPSDPRQLVGNGYLQPTLAKEKSALRFGVDSDVYLCNNLFPSEQIQLMPYGQTDFRDKARIGGIDALWEPFNPMSHLGGRTDVITPALFDAYVRLLGEANAFDVGNPGLTNFMSNTAYALLGGAAELRGVLFQNMPSVGPFLCGRIAIVVPPGMWLEFGVARSPVT